MCRDKSWNICWAENQPIIICQTGGHNSNVAIKNNKSILSSEQQLPLKVKVSPSLFLYQISGIRDEEKAEFKC